MDVSEIKTTKEHRAIVQTARFPTTMTNDERAWVDGDDDAGWRCGTLSFPRAAELVARVDAEAEARGRARGRLEALVACADFDHVVAGWAAERLGVTMPEDE